VRKLIEVLKRLGLWRPSVWEENSQLAPASPTLTLSGTCERDVFYEDLYPGHIFTDSLFRIRAAMSGFAPNSEYVLLIKESPSGQTTGTFPKTDATGAWSAPIYIHGFPPESNPPPSITLTGAVGTNADRDGDLEAGEIVATDSFTIVCPERHLG
jgi:hypothetical protein